MKHGAFTLIAAALLLAAPVASQAALTSYAQNFEALDASSPTALSADGWVVYGNVYNAADVYQYGYGTFPAPNPGAGFCAVAVGQGGALQGNQQLSVYDDYNNTDHSKGWLIESNVYQEQAVSAADVGAQWTFQFDAKMGNLVFPSTAAGFIKTINPSAGYATTNYVKNDMTAIPATWNTYYVSLTIDPSLVGQLLQFGFTTTATYYQGSGVFYDNLTFTKTAGAGVAPAGGAHVLDLRPASPNPSQGPTRLDYALPKAGLADVTVYDVTGRRVATLAHGEQDAGPHSATWDGRLADGRVAPAGVYRAVLETPAGRLSRPIVLTH